MAETPSATAQTPGTGAIAAPHALATEAGRRVYRDGGTAIDAAIAAAAVLTVVYPHNVALGGDLIALVRTPDGVVRCVNASGWAAAASDPAAVRARCGARLPIRGADVVTVPGGVRGWEALRGFGARSSWSDTLAAAEQAARDGAPVAPSLARNLVHPDNVGLLDDPAFAAAFAPGGRVAGVGDVLVQPALAETFAALRAGGPDAFYRGRLAASHLDMLRRRGSVLDAADLADFAAEVVEPLAMPFAGLTVMTSPPNTQGFLLLRALRAVHERGMRDPLGADLGALATVFGAGNAARAARLADPRRAEVDVAALLDPACAPAPSDLDVAGHAGGDTVGVAAADDRGYAVSLIMSVYHAFGSGLLDPATGVLFHNRGLGFSLDPASPNLLAPRTRPAHTLMPAMTVDGTGVRHVLATMGGQGQPQILAQVLLRLLAGAGAAAAVGAPRVVVGARRRGQRGERVTVEDDVAPSALASVRAAGLSVSRVPAHTEELGHTNVVVVGPDGAFDAASDPRSDGAAAVTDLPDGR